MIALACIGLGVLIILGALTYYASVTGGLLSLSGLMLVILVAIGLALVANGFGLVSVVPVGAG